MKKRLEPRGGARRAVPDDPAREDAGGCSQTNPESCVQGESRQGADERTDTAGGASQGADERLGIAVFDIESLAELAKLRLTDAEKQQITKELEHMTAAVSKVLDRYAAQAAPPARPAAVNVFRRDIPERSPSRSELLSNAQKKTDQYIYVPKV